MALNGLMNYEDIWNLQGSVAEMQERGEEDPYYFIAEDYCQNALNYIDLMKKRGFTADITLDSLQGIFVGIMELYKRNLAFGIPHEANVIALPEQLKGYVLFALHNDYVAKGNKVIIMANEAASGLCLKVSDGVGGETLIDVSDAVDRAWECISLTKDDKGVSLKCDTDEFMDALLGR